MFENLTYKCKVLFHQISFIVSKVLFTNASAHSSVRYYSFGKVVEEHVIKLVKPGQEPAISLTGAQAGA